MFKIEMTETGITRIPLPWWEGMMGRGSLILFTLTLTLSHRGRGGYFVILEI